MPRVRIKKESYMVSDLRNLIRGKAKNMKLSQKQIAEELNITQSAYSKRLERMAFNANELITIFRVLDFSGEEIAKHMKE